MILKILLVSLGLTLSTFLFKKAAGSLSIRKLNLISYAYYLFVLQTYIGTSLVFLGDRNHYTINYLINEKSINTTFIFVLLTAIMLPLVIVLVHKVLRVNMDEIYEIYLAKSTSVENEKIIFYIVLAMSGLSIILMILLFCKIGYVPLMKLIFHDSAFNFKTERIKVSNVTLINQYVKNILVLSFIPIMSYISFAYAYITKNMRWKVLFIILLACSLFTKTYNFAKTPVIFYIFTFVIMFIFLNNGIKRKLMCFILSGLGGMILLMYKVTGYVFEFSIYNGPISRIIFTQAGTLMYHFDLFPTSVPFLMGRSLSGTVIGLLGLGVEPVRSAKVVMSFYGSKSVYDGIAGVMNTFFIGEAYANFGNIGVILSIIYIGLLFGIIYYIFTKKMKKTALNVVLFAILTSELANTTQGGFFDFIYNANTIITIMVFIFIRYSSEGIKWYLEKKKYGKNTVKIKK